MIDKEASLSFDLNTLSHHVQSLREQVQLILNQLPGLRNDYSKLQAYVSTYKEEVKGPVVEIEKLKGLVSIIREEFARNLTSLHDALIKIIEEKFKYLLCVDEAHKELKEALEKLALQIEGISLDSRNALVRSNNNDIHIQLNKKKLENLQLLMKNHELNK